jgi:hypothetical protein
MPTREIELQRNRFSTRTFTASLLVMAVSSGCWAQNVPPMRPPAVPLVAHDPYFSVWSMADRLADNNTQHWTGKPNTLNALVRINGKTYRIMGRDAVPRSRQGLPALDQKSVQVLPTRTLYTFAGSGIDLGLTFFTPALPNDLDVLSRPLTYIEWKASSNDGRPHDVSIYFDASGDLAVNTAEQPILSSRYMLDGQPILRIGSREQPVLAKRGDDLRIDWGYLYLAADKPDGLRMSTMMRPDAHAALVQTGELPSSDDFSERAPARRSIQDVLAATLNLGQVGATPVQRYLMLAYDDIWAIEYFQRRERAWWRRNGDEASDLILKSRREHDELMRRASAFDEELMADMKRIGGEEYARLGSLAYRQTLAAHKLIADVDGTPIYLPKENFSNGCVATVDVIYPSAPFMLLFNPRLLRAQLQPVLDYARMARWKWSFAPHDLGTYPQANGQVYGGGERTEENQMPVEESGNMLIMLAALARVEGNASYAERYWPEISKWAAYLKEKGLDPENQLSTDDFAGHLAHNANLSIKAILALASYGILAEMTGHKELGAEYRRIARGFAERWIGLAAEGDHYKLAFDQPGSWSQKYNLVWDQLLDLKIFPPEVARKEIAFYKTKLNKYGLPLDNRKDYTKLDWILWTATLAGDAPGFNALTVPAYRFADESPSRVPLTDWYDTVTGKQQGFQARSVVGGVFIKMLQDPALWRKYAARTGEMK